MNFSKKETTQKQKYMKSNSKKLARKAGVSFFRTFLVCLVMIIIIGVVAGFGVLKGIIDNAPSIDSINVAPEGFASTIYDSKGNPIQKLVGSGANRVYKEIDEIPKVVQDAFIAIEDARFWTHHGIDVKGIFRAFFTGLAQNDFDQGASTLTQQLLKNQVFEGGMETTFAEKLERKIQEQYLAIQLEDKLSKKQILEYYLNTINLGQNTLGVQSASLRYFNKDVGDLTLSEATVIAGITKSPFGFNPITSPEKNAERRLLILDNMKTQGYISETQYNTAIADKVYDRIQLVNEERYSSGSTVNSYFVDEVIEQVMKDLQEQLGYSSTQAYNLIYRRGLQIHTTQNTKLQKICDEVLQDESLYPANSEYELTYRLTVVDKKGEKRNYNELMLKDYFNKKNSNFTLYFKNKDDAKPFIKEYHKSVIKKGETVEGEVISYTIQPQISFALMDQATGKVLAIVGGRGKKTGNLTLNRASNTVRQPGSTFKIVSTYLPALDTKGVTLASVKDDAYYTYPGTAKKVNNWNGEKYNGLTSIRQAIYNSMNVMAVKTLEDVTPQTSFSYLQKLGFTTLVDSRTDETTGKVFSDINYPLALGGLTDGVTNIELTGAFSAIANGGTYRKPILYNKIIDHNGKILINNKPKSSQVMKDTTSWLLTSAMEDVVKIGTGGKTRFQSVDMPVAGKTGTTNNDLDLWFVGYTPYYTAGIWGGYDNNKKQSDTSYPKILWRTIMERIHEKLERKEFTKPDSIITATICTKCGKLAVDGLCNRAIGGPAVKKEFFAKGTQPTENCDCHVKVKICSSSGKTPNRYCPVSFITQKVYLTKDETSPTADTPFILPKNFDRSTCNVHGSKQIPETNTEENENTEDLENVDDTNLETPETMDPSSEEEQPQETETATPIPDSSLPPLEP